MAINVYLTLFKKYNARQLKALEWRYHLMGYGLPFIVALVYLFINVPGKEKIYGPATRIALVYGPAWVCILISFTLYVLAGREIFKKRQQLRVFSNQQSRYPGDLENPFTFTSYKTTEVRITSEPVSAIDDNDAEQLPPPNRSLSVSSGAHTTVYGGGGDSTKKFKRETGSSKYDQYSVNISSAPLSPLSMRPISEVQNMPGATGAAVMQYRNNKAALEANTAAWGYTKVALLFFVSLLVTWVINHGGAIVEQLVMEERSTFIVDFIAWAALRFEK
ncbi:MAG: hypothetical protein Q9190_000904 [Brigantiaea leucoxantha]